jgi:hypothetical protein
LIETVILKTVHLMQEWLLTIKEKDVENAVKIPVLEDNI